MAYSGKRSPNSTTQLDTVAWTSKSPTYKPSYGGLTNGLKGDNLDKRTSSPNSQDEKLFENHPDAPTK